MSFEDSSEKRILIYIAMWNEAKPTIDFLGLEKEKVIFPGFQVFRGRAKKKNHTFDYTLLTPGEDPVYFVDKVGTQFAALGATVGIANYKPHLVLNVGTAGGFSAGSGEIGQTFLGTKFVYHDRRIPLPQFAQYGVGGFETFFVCALPFCNATVTTGNSLDVTVAELSVMKELAKEGPLLKDMEATAIAEVCSACSTNVPFLALKSVTDVVDGKRPTGDEFVQNLQLASDNVRKKLAELLCLLDDVTLSNFFIGRDRTLVERILALRLKLLA